MSRLEGKITVVTGGVRGIGGGIVEAFAAEGADVAVADILTEGEAAPVLASVERLGRRGLVAPRWALIRLSGPALWLQRRSKRL